MGIEQQEYKKGSFQCTLTITQTQTDRRFADERQSWDETRGLTVAQIIDRHPEPLSNYDDRFVRAGHGLDGSIRSHRLSAPSIAETFRLL